MSIVRSGCLGEELRQIRGNHAAGDDRGRRDPHAALGRRSARPDLLLHGIQIGEHANAEVVEPVTRFGDGETARTAPDQLGSEMGFKSADLLAHRRLNHPLRLSGAREAAGFGDPHEEPHPVYLIHSIAFPLTKPPATFQIGILGIM